MSARPGLAQPRHNAGLIARAVGAVALATLAVIHVIDLPGTLGPLPLIGAGYLAIITTAIVVGGVMITRSHRLAWAATRLTNLTFPPGPATRHALEYSHSR